MELIAQGAEAKLYLNDKLLVKERVSKGYRLKELDEELRKTRTRREARLLEKLEKLSIPAPRLISYDDREMVIEMEFVDGKILSRHLNSHNIATICPKIGEVVGRLHMQNIIHGDLTTSNMILKANKLYLIDFGLSFYSTKLEDMAVELHVLKQALESKHYGFWQRAYMLIEKEYKKHFSRAEPVLKRLEKVEARGRYK